MKCIVGLGNPGKKYEDTRHNIGFRVIDELASRNHWSLSQKKFNGLFTMERLNGDKVVLLKPQTYMNLSGESLRPLMDFYDIEVGDVLVVYDDLDLPPGKIRLRKKGGHGGHNGIRNIIDQLGTKEFKRLRVGVGRPEGSKTVIDHVLGSFNKEEQEPVTESVDFAVKACEAWLGQTFNEVMNDFNVK
ncbi:peptidyl-tRNA hydrolase [Halobacillus karajensis]|uniref:Peptidyl-tRNA hydrolase n=1 Tax=Halobacillus karajensis TaxID=195088 RepID=A0A024PA24_9BACI|nr:aminoacyl-tRNA hydrolase [Halobacillus karajensis]CDQ21779.1 Peptidyl-tRNA hydrolase [Halobacillus karajensis]CDQ25775.1 Peptidyl-tRNA hydrolase [Halobacillus karajensis]CDQ29776.1 Peptidyl-tRNA hydrolase [Halobacillus karajensis]SEI12465.1 peptidyl-tRNA hydrolase [Halobacillus karajensis]